MAFDSEAELYAHAIAIEREAAARYAELAERMDDLGNDAVAALFRMLASQEARHLEELERRAAGMALPAAGASHGWLTYGPPETVARELVFRFMTQREALLIARAAEARADAFFRHAAWVTPDPEVRALAREMAAEEAQHIVMIDRLLERMAPPRVDWEAALCSP